MHPEDTSPHVPLLQDIDILVSDEIVAFEAAKKAQSLTAGKRRRLRGKQACSEYDTKPLRYTYTDKDGKPLRRSYAEAWTDYRCKHVVSKWAARIIRQWNASHLADSLEALEEDDRNDSKRQRDPIDGSWMDLNAVRDILQNSASAERRRAGDNDIIKISAHAQLVEEAKSITEKLWSFHTTVNLPVDIMNKQPSIVLTSAEKATKRKAETPQENSEERDKKANLVYQKFSVRKARIWLHALRTATNSKSPSEEQVRCLEAIIKRCEVEAHETDINSEFRSEPLRLLLHGVPGAGKTQTLLWIRKFFEEICAWTHGQEFVFCASQNSMTSLIKGVTLHSFFKLAFKHKDGTPMNVQHQDKTDMSLEYIKYQGLRFVFIDEFSTAAVEIFAEINDQSCKHVRKNNTWSLRKVGKEISERPFGGLNMVVSGDAWQFGPIGSCGAVFDNPTRMQSVAAHSTIADMSNLRK